MRKYVCERKYIQRMARDSVWVEMEMWRSGGRDIPGDVGRDPPSRIGGGVKHTVYEE